MATQKRFTNYKASVESFPLGEEKVGLFKPGRYNGFDIMTTDDNINLTISHSGIITKASTEVNGIDIYGALITPTGLVIHEEGSINVVLPPTAPPANSLSVVRKFILVCEHNYQAVQGGVPASYFIIANPDLGDIVPELPDNTTQVMLGVITKHHDTNELTYEKVQTPLIGDRSPQELYDLIKEFIDIPSPEELPDISSMVANMINLNKPRTIITGREDIGDDANTGEWKTITRDVAPSINPGHDIPLQIVKYRRLHMANGADMIDIEIVNVGVPKDRPAITWDNVNVIGMSYVSQDMSVGQTLYVPQEIRKKDLQGSSGSGTVRRFFIAEAGGYLQSTSLKVVIQLKSVFIPQEVEDNT